MDFIRSLLQESNNPRSTRGRVAQRASNLTLLREATEHIRAEDTTILNFLKESMSVLPPFPGIELRRQIEELIRKTSHMIAEYARKAKPWVQDRGYNTEIFNTMLQNPEKVAKRLISKYSSEYADDAIRFNIRDALKDISLDIENNAKEVNGDWVNGRWVNNPANVGKNKEWSPHHNSAVSPAVEMG